MKIKKGVVGGDGGRMGAVGKQSILISTKMQHSFATGRRPGPAGRCGGRGRGQGLGRCRDLLPLHRHNRLETWEGVHAPAGSGLSGAAKLGDRRKGRGQERSNCCGQQENLFRPAQRRITAGVLFSPVGSDCFQRTCEDEKLRLKNCKLFRLSERSRHS